MRPLHVPSTRSRYRQNPFATQWGVVYAAGVGIPPGPRVGHRDVQWPDNLRQLATLAYPVGLPIVVVTAWYVSLPTLRVGRRTCGSCRFHFPYPVLVVVLTFSHLQHVFVLLQQR
jgi:hypothetical protein